MAKKTKNPDFEAALGELETIVDGMEHGQLNLEESLRQFERGIQLTRHCQQALGDAEQKIQILLKEDDSSKPEDFESTDLDGEAT